MRPAGAYLPSLSFLFCGWSYLLSNAFYYRTLRTPGCLCKNADSKATANFLIIVFFGLQPNLTFCASLLILSSLFGRLFQRIFLRCPLLSSKNRFFYHVFHVCRRGRPSIFCSFFSWVFVFAKIFVPRNQTRTWHLFFPKKVEKPQTFS